MVERALRDIGEDKSLLLVDDDEPFLRRLARAMEKRGFEVSAVETVAEGKAIINNSGLDVIAADDLKDGAQKIVKAVKG